MADLLYVDDKTVVDSADLWRRIPPQWAVRDDNQGRWRVTSAAFSDSPDRSPLSVLLADLVTSAGRTPADILAQFEGYFLATFTAGVARESGQGIARTPTPDEPAHASVFGRKTDAVRRKLARATRWVVGPQIESGGR
jgi:hypothetical protein